MTKSPANALRQREKALIQALLRGDKTCIEHFFNVYCKTLFDLVFACSAHPIEENRAAFLMQFKQLLMHNDWALLRAFRFRCSLKSFLWSLMAHAQMSLFPHVCTIDCLPSAHRHGRYYRAMILQRAIRHEKAAGKVYSARIRRKKRSFSQKS